MGTPRTFAFVSLAATGPDPRVDRVFRLAARVPDGKGAAQEHAWLACPSLGVDGAARESVSARVHRVYGVSGAELADQPPADRVFPVLRSSVAGRALVAFDRETFLRWWRSLDEGMREPTVVGVSELARLVLPGRRSADRDALLALAFAPGETPKGEPTPRELERLLAAVARAFLSRPNDHLALAASALRDVLQRLRSADPDAAAVLEAGLDLLDRPSAWRTRDGELFAAAAELVDGEVSKRAGDLDRATRAYDRATPRITSDLRDVFDGEPIPDLSAEPVELGERDRAAVDAIFEEWLPRAMAEVAGSTDPRAFFRPGQRELARRVADALGKREVLLVDAPTGTGKTMAYLVPALLWAMRARVRVGVSTFTIALQEQVFDRELPRALALLRRAGVEGGARSTVLKGRERYLCGRALRAAAPEPFDPPERWLAWTVLALFALDDPDCDLDRLPRRLPLPIERAERGEDALAALMREVACRTQCCDQVEDLLRCGAWVARRRAERCHLVVTNHAFVLRDPSFLRNLIADECDHMHAQARSAASIELSLRSMRDAVESVGGASARAPLGRVERAISERWLPEVDPLRISARVARRAAETSLDGIARLEASVRVYLRFVEETQRETGFDSHRVFEEFATRSSHGPALIAARESLALALSELAGACEELAAGADALGDQGNARLRQRLHRASTSLSELAIDLKAWLPTVDHEVKLDATCYYDVELEPGRGGNVVLKRFILLPQRWLAERYFPSMQSCSLLSASTYLQGGFELSRAYLGLDLLEAGGENREPRPVATHRAPSTFDYSRVLLTVPTDVPDASFGSAQSRAPFDRYVESFLRHLVERTRGRALVLLTNLSQCRSLGRALEPYFRERCIPFFWQGMEGRAKEELPRLFRSADGGVLMGVDTFWYGVDFPGDVLEYLVVAKLPFGPLDRYTRAQRAALGEPEHTRTIYLPEALSMFRQGFGRLMRRETDRGAVFVLDARILKRWRRFLRELPGRDETTDEDRRLQELVGTTEECVRRALAHCGRLEECRRLGLDLHFAAPMQ